MTGAERLEQVRHGLGNLCYAEGDLAWDTRDLLDGCVLLTAEEAAGIVLSLESLHLRRSPSQEAMDAFALLTPEGSDDAD